MNVGSLDEVERAIIGSVLVDPTRFDLAIEARLDARHFRRNHTRESWRSIARIVERGERPDPLTVSADLSRRGFGDDVSPASLAAMVDAIPRGANVQAWVRLLQADARDREFEYALTNALEVTRKDGAEAGRERLEIALADHSSTSTQGPVVRTARSVLDDPPVEPFLTAWPFLLPANVTVIAGAPAVGKTFLSIRIASEFVLSGRRVLFGALEGIAASRFAAAVEAWGLSATDLDRLLVVNALDLQNARAVRSLAAGVGSVDLVICDTWAALLAGFGGDENDALAATRAVTAIRNLCADLGGAAALVLHHVSLGQARERGSGALRGSVDVLGFLEDEGEGRVLRLDKLRDGPVAHPRRFRLRAVLNSVVLEDAERVLDAQTEAELSPKTTLVLQNLRSLGTTSTSALIEALEGRVARSVVFGALQALERTGLARKSGRGQWTPVGPGITPDFGPKSEPTNGQVLTESGS